MPHVQEKDTAALKKAKLAETKVKLKEEDAKLEEQERAMQVCTNQRVERVREPQGEMDGGGKGERGAGLGSMCRMCFLVFENASLGRRT